MQLETKHDKLVHYLKWYKMDKMVSNNFRLELHNLKAKNTGVYKCVLVKELSNSSIEYHILFSKDKIPEIVFNFVENDIRPFGQVLVICENRSKLKILFSKQILDIFIFRSS